MNLTIIKNEFFIRRTSIIWWSIGILILIVITLSFYSSFKDQSASLQKAFSDIPESAMAFLSDAGNFFTPVGYISSKLFYAVLPMTISILTISLGSSLIAKEEKDSTIELLLSRPISRTQLLFSKFITGATILAIVSVVTALSTLSVVILAKIDISYINIIMTTLACTLLAGVFGSIAFLISAIGRARVASVGIATLFALAGYIISSLSSVESWLKIPAKLFAFTYYKPAEILEGHYNLFNFAVFIGIIISCLTLSWLIFRRRDLVN